MQVIQIIQLILFSTITIVTAAAGGYCRKEAEQAAEQRREEQREEGIEVQEREKVHAKLESPKGKLSRCEMGRLIARNHDEIDQLRRVGDRDYFEFTIEEGKAQEVGNVTVELKSINSKKNLFTIDVKTDAGTFEQKNHSVNKPIFFYATEDHSVVVELVVNKLTKNQASGYLSVRKATLKHASSRTSG